LTAFITIARPYAQAIFKSAQKSGQLEQWSDVLNVLSSVVENQEIALLLSDPTVSAHALKELLLNLLRHFSEKAVKELNESVNALLVLLIQVKRLPALPSIAVLYHEFLIKQKGVIEAIVSSPFPLSEAQQQKITRFLEKRFHADLSLVVVRDPALLGGVSIRVGEWVMDGSIKGRLNQLSEHLIG
jgi:F-type H+-transporting ATPase subunit delta